MTFTVYPALLSFSNFLHTATVMYCPHLCACSSAPTLMLQDLLLYAVYNTDGENLVLFFCVTKLSHIHCYYSVHISMKLVVEVLVDQTI